MESVQQPSILKNCLETVDSLRLMLAKRVPQLQSDIEQALLPRRYLFFQNFSFYELLFPFIFGHSVWRILISTMPVCCDFLFSAIYNSWYSFFFFLGARKSLILPWHELLILWSTIGLRNHRRWQPLDFVFLHLKQQRSWKSAVLFLSKVISRTLELIVNFL